MDSTELADLEKLDVAPFIYSAHEFSVPAEAMRINFTDDENDSTPSTKYNPPYTQYVRTNATLSGSSSGDFSYYRCVYPSLCTTSVIRSHLPIVTTFDPVRDVTVHGWVQTDSDGGDSLGDMWLHAGFYSSTTLNAGNKLDPATEIGMPTSGTNWVWTGRTHHAPAIACANTTTGWDGYNCLLAWNDRGLASTAGDAVLLKFFRVSSSGTAIELKPGNAEVRAGSNTGTSPTLAFFDSKFWLALKTTVSVPNIKVFTRPNAATGWSTAATFGAADAVGPPSWHHTYNGSNTETALIWTITE